MMLSQRIKDERTRQGLSQEELGSIVGVTQQAVGKWEKGVAEPDVETLKKLALRFKCTLDYLLELTDQRDGHAEFVSEETTKYLINDYKSLELAMRIKKLPERDRMAFETLLDMAERKSNNEAAAGE